MSGSGQPPLIIIIGGAIAGAESARFFADLGATVIVIEQNQRPYGKVEDGLPRWHLKLQQKHIREIDDHLSLPTVHLVPRTQVGADIRLDQIQTWQPDAVIFASGAWRDRPLSIPGVERHLGKRFCYQNRFVYWFNHYLDQAYDGDQVDIQDHALVVGGGLASIDVVKILQIELARKAFKERGISYTSPALEHGNGLRAALDQHRLTLTDLGLTGATLIYRKPAEELPLAPIPPTATEAERLKRKQVSLKLLSLAQQKFLFRFLPAHLPVGLLEENDQLVGLKLMPTSAHGEPLPGAASVDVRSRLIISSIGSIPHPIEGLTLNGERYRLSDGETCQAAGFENVYLVGNAVTGKGNIITSQRHARMVCEKILARLQNRIRGGAKIELALAKIRERQREVGYPGDYRTYRDMVRWQNPDAGTMHG